MNTVKWELPFKTEHYLQALTQEIGGHLDIVLIIAVMNSEGVIDSCKINFKVPPSPDEILELGTVIGAHSMVYADEQARLKKVKATLKKEFEKVLEDAKEAVAKEKVPEAPKEESKEEEEEVPIEKEIVEEEKKEDTAPEEEAKEEEEIKIQIIKVPMDNISELLKVLLENFKK